MARGAVVFIVGFVVAASLVSIARVWPQTPADPLANDIAVVQSEIRQAEADDQNYTGGLIKSLISLRLATLRQTLAMLDQRAKARAARTTLQYTVDGRPFLPPADAAQQVALVEKELAENAAKLEKGEAEAARYSGGLIRATALTTVATMRQTQAMLDQKRLALKYGLPQYIGFKDSTTAPAAPASQAVVPGATGSSGPAPAAQQNPQPAIPADCMKVVFGSFCLGAPITSLAANPAKKTDEMWIYLEPQPTTAGIVEGRVAYVGRLYSPGTWLTYRNLESDLLEKYGNGKDLSYFPSHANDSGSKETSIALKKGRAIRSWQQQGYTIQLKWESSDNVVLIYYHDELEAKRAAKKKDQL